MFKMMISFSWGDKNVGIHVLMGEITGESVYKNSLKQFCDHAVSGQTRSPNGMLYYYQWGLLRYASNAVLICLKVRKHMFFGRPLSVELIENNK